MFRQYYSKQFLETLSEFDAETRRWILHLLNNVNKKENKVLIGRKTCYKLEQPEQEFNHHYSTKLFLKRIERQFPALVINGYKEYEMVRTIDVDKRGLPATVMKAWAADVFWKNDDRYHFLTSNKYNRNTATELRRQEEKEINMKTGTQTLDYLNNLSSKHFQSLVNKKLKETQDRIENDLREANILKTIQEQPKQYYSLSEKSYRLAPQGNKWCSLKSEFRKYIMKGTVEFDFDNLYWSLFAWKFDMPILSRLLQENDKRIWNYFEKLGYDKKIVKEALVGVLFGQMKKNTKESLLAAGATEDQVKEILALPVMKELRKTYRQQHKRIKEQYKCHSTETRAILHQELSKTEFELLEIFCEYAIKNEDECSMILYQYDGCSFVFSKDEDKHIRRITEAINAKCDELGILTNIKSEKL